MCMATVLRKFRDYCSTFKVELYLLYLNSWWYLVKKKLCTINKGRRQVVKEVSMICSLLYM